MFTHSTILGPLFWIVLGLLYAFIIYTAKLWFEDLKINMNRLKWFLVILFLIILYVTIGGGFTLIGEDEQHAGIYFMGIGLVICSILGVGLWRYLKSDGDKA